MIVKGVYNIANKAPPLPKNNTAAVKHKIFTLSAHIILFIRNTYNRSLGYMSVHIIIEISAIHDLKESY